MNSSAPEHPPFDPTFTSPFAEGMGLRFGEYGDGWSDVWLDLRPEFINGIGFVAGGVYAAMVDFALVAAIRTQLPAAQSIMTTDITFRYLRPARSGPLRGRGKVIDIGRRIVLAEAEIFLGDMLLVKGSGSFMRVAKRDAAGESS
jgi:acyl-CoA thioesterase